MKKFLSFILVFALALSMSSVALATDKNVTSQAEWDSVVGNGSTLQDGDEIIVTGDTTITIGAKVVIDGINVTISGGKFTSAVEDVFEVKNSGTLTLAGGMTVTSSESILYANGGTIIVEGATLTTSHATHNLAFATGSGSTITVKDGELSQTSGAATMSIKNGATLNVEGGEIKGNGTAIVVRGNANAYISDGEVSTGSVGDDYVAIVTSGGGKATISGSAEVKGGTTHAVAATSDGIVEITGGTITAGSSGDAIIAWENPNARITISGGDIDGVVETETGATMAITGGTFTADPSAYLADNTNAVRSSIGKTYVGDDDEIAEVLDNAAEDEEFTVIKKTDTADLPDVGETVTPNEHTHAYGEWTSNGDGTHTRTCAGDSSHEETEDCSGGKATCCAKAECEKCGEAYGEFDSANHAGGEEVRGEVAATTEADGYTGDTYCLGCGEKIAEGETIPKLEPEPEDPAPVTKPDRNNIKVTYKGGNTFSTSKSAVPTAVEIDGVPVSFVGDGKSFTVDCIEPGSHWITVRWYSTSVTTNFTADVTVTCIPGAIPKTGDVSVIGYALMAVVAAAGAMLKK